MESIFQAGMVVEEGGKSASSVPWKTKQNKTKPPRWKGTKWGVGIEDEHWHPHVWGGGPLQKLTQDADHSGWLWEEEWRSLVRGLQGGT